MCTCNAEETAGEVITIQLNGRCPVCSSQYYIAMPKPAVQAVQRPKQQAFVVSIDSYMERRMKMARELNARIGYRPADWVSGVLAL
jgi:hypothetical protein